jgi:hypothetical protein
MTDTTAAFDSVIPFDGRVISLGAYGRAIFNNALPGLAAVAIVATLVVAVTFTSAWILNVALFRSGGLIGSERNGPQRLALATSYPRLTSANAAPSRMPHRGSQPAALTFDAKWKRAVGPRPNAKTVRLTQVRPSSIPNPLILPPPARRMPVIPPAPATLRLAGLDPIVAVPTIEPASRLPAEPRIANIVPLPRAYPASAPARQVASRPVGPASIRPRQRSGNRPVFLPGPDSRTAVYDIAAHTVYLPNGERLEAHSGLGSKIDDPRYVRVKNRGPTPPNVYDLSLRERLFHGVRAIRLTPVSGSRMFGRDGMLAHTYMLGPNGQSNGCVSFKNYQAFLRAYLHGEINRLVVVPRLDDAPQRLADAIRSHSHEAADARYAANQPSEPPTVVTW